MALKTYPTAPYYDDFDKAKNYMRILFRPGYSVQARELTQMQTAIQAQIDRFGRHVFKEGSPAVGGLATLDTRFAYVKLVSGGDPNPDNFYTQLIGTTVTGQTSGITATVLDATPSEDSDPLTLFVKYTSTATLDAYDGITQFFLAGEDLVSSGPSSGAPTYTVTVADLETDPVGYGTRVSVDEGAFFVSGNFVYTPSSSIILEKYTANASARVVYIVEEGVIGSVTDVTLKDNAAGSPNDSAPGADRYQISLTLAKQPIDLVDRDEANIIQLLVIKNGKVQSTARTDYSELGDILAKRTYEESGNYTVRPFQINIKEYLNDGTNGGQYTEAEITSKITDFGVDGTAAVYGERRLAVGLEPSVAYVNGYRINLEDTAYVPVEKARDLDTLNNQSFAAIYKNYIDVEDVVGLPDIVNFTQLELRKSDSGSTLIGSARARSFKHVSGSTYRLYLFDVLLGDGHTYAEIGRVDYSYGTGVHPFEANVVSSSLGVAPNSMLFKLPVNNVKTLTDLETVYDVRIKKTVYVSTNSVTLSLTGGDTFANISPSDWIACEPSSGTILTISDININTSGGADITFSGSSIGANVTIIVPVTRSNSSATPRTKSYISTGSFSSGDSPNLTAGGYDSLGRIDVIKLKNVYMAADFSTAALITDTDITDRYILDNGQRDNFYDIARIQLKPGASAPTGRIMVEYDYFAHSSSGDYFSVDSYTTAGCDYENIPSFQSSLGMVQLRDVLDFRPSRDPDTGDFADPGAPIDPNSTIMADIQYYMPRIDKIFVNKLGQFGVVKGDSSTYPVAKEDPKDAMVLYVLRLGAYTFNAADTIPSIVDNKRYTMRDIGKIEKRVSKLEYYTSLSLLEKETSVTQIFDDGAVRYKNGFVVDSFYGHNIGAITHPDYTVSMDKATGKLRPMFYEDNARLILNTDDLHVAGLRKTGPLLTLDYYSTTAISQPYASYSEYINPYNVFNWTGDLSLSPNTDEWKETKRAPDVVIDQTGIYDTLVSMLDQTGAIGTVWNEWTTNWSGTEQISDISTKLYNGDPLVSVADISTTITTTTTAQQSRNGIRTSIVPDTVITDMGDKVVEVNFVPFIRSRKIYFKATRLKPNTRMYAFFDGINMADYVRGEDSVVEYSDRTTVDNYLNSASHPDGASPLTTDGTGTLIGSFVIPNTDVLKFKTGPRLFRLTNSSTNARNPDTSAETSYFAQGTMNTVEHNVVSTRVPQINRTQVNDQKVTVDRSSNTTTEQYYHQNIPVFTDSVPEPLPVPNPIPEAVIVDPVISNWASVEPTPEPEPGVWTNSMRFSAITYVDPLAQSFIIDSPQGAFITSLDLFFEEKDETVPVTVQIRTMVNGAPTQTVVPFSQVTLAAANINATEDATTATTFIFEAPVHLMQGVEYCFVVLSNSNKHKIYVSELGQYDVTEPSYRITKQPYNGVMFKSANASTWTPEQTKDIKFTLRRAAFAQTGTATFVNAPLPLAKLDNPIQTTNASGTVRILHKNHGHFAGSSYVTLSGITADVNGITTTNLNKTHSVVSVEIDSYTIVPGGTANKTGRGGGTSVYVTENKTYNVLHPIVQQSIIPATDITWKAKVTTGKSLAGAEGPHTVSNYMGIKVNDNTFFNHPYTIVSQANITPSILNGGEPYSFYLQGVLTTALENISPVIDLDRMSVVTVANRIDNPAASAETGVSNAVRNFTEETEPSGGSRLSKYITRKIELNDPATSLHIYTLVNRPTGAGIELFYKTLPNGSDANFDDLPWIGHASIANAGVSPDNLIPITDNPNDYTEAQYNILEMDEFSAFAVKITFTAQNSSAVPTCRDFRAIAST